MAAVIDSSVLIHFEGAPGRFNEFLAEEGDLAIPTVSASEVLVGVHFADAAHRTAREAFVEDVLDTIPLLPFDLRAARVHARLVADLSVSKRGRKRVLDIGAHDLLIGAIALADGREVLTFNERDFRKIPGLKVRVLAS